MSGRLANRALRPERFVRGIQIATSVCCRYAFIRASLFAALLGATSTVMAAADIDALWEYDDPAASEARFKTAITDARGDERLELLTQIARTYGLRRHFDEANHVLDDVASELTNAGPRPRVRYLLERGRVFNSSGAPERARPFFVDAWVQARSAELDGLAVDAAHMVAITYGGTEPAIDWNRNALDLARASTDAKATALIPALLNNSGWDLQDMGRYREALPFFQEALKEWTARAKPAQIRFARWSVARCLRSLDRFSEALPIQLALEREDKAQGKVDGYVLEELAELYEGLGQRKAARPYFARAADVLSKDEDFVKNEPKRLARLQSMGR